jgi:hypothetical protein
LTKKNEEIMERLEAFDLTRCATSAAELASSDRKTVQRYVGLRDAGRDPLEHARRARLIDSYMEKVEELVDSSKGRVRADVVHDRLRAMGYAGTERTTRRAVHKAKLAYRNGNRRTYRPWIPEPRQVAAVRLGLGTGGGDAPDVPVLHMAGLVSISRRHPNLGQDAGHRAHLP